MFCIPGVCKFANNVVHKFWPPWMYHWYFLYDFDRASSLMCGNKMPTRWNRGFYCSSHCLLNIFRTPLCPSSGAQEYRQGLLPVVFCVVVFKFLVWCGAEGCVSGLQDDVASCKTGHITLTQQSLYNSLELQMMGIVVPETCWASNKICNKNLCCI